MQHQNSSFGSFQCIVCKIKFDDFEDHKQHYFVFHSKNAIATSYAAVASLQPLKAKDKANDKSNVTKPVVVEFKCDACDIVCSSEIAYDFHVQGKKHLSAINKKSVTIKGNQKTNGKVISETKKVKAVTNGNVINSFIKKKPIITNQNTLLSVYKVKDTILDQSKVNHTVELISRKEKAVTNGNVINNFIKKKQIITNQNTLLSVSKVKDTIFDQSKVNHTVDLISRIKERVAKKKLNNSDITSIKLEANHTVNSVLKIKSEMFIPISEADYTIDDRRQSIPIAYTNATIKQEMIMPIFNINDNIDIDHINPMTNGEMGNITNNVSKCVSQKTNVLSNCNQFKMPFNGVKQEKSLVINNKEMIMPIFNANYNIDIDHINPMTNGDMGTITGNASKSVSQKSNVLSNCDQLKMHFNGVQEETSLGINKNVSVIGKNEPSMYCDICDIILHIDFKDDPLQFHLKSDKHKKALKMKKYMELKSLKDPSVYCDICKIFRYPDLMTIHKDGGKHKRPCKDISWNEPVEKKSKFIDSVTNVNYCGYCLMSLLTITEIIDHYQSPGHLANFVKMENSIPYCSICDLEFNDRNYLNSHLKGYKHYVKANEGIQYPKGYYASRLMKERLYLVNQCPFEFSYQGKYKFVYEPIKTLKLTLVASMPPSSLVAYDDDL